MMKAVWIKLTAGKLENDAIEDSLYGPTPEEVKDTPCISRQWDSAALLNSGVKC